MVLQALPDMGGDEEFEAFFAATYPRVVRVLGLGWNDQPAAEEATQEAFARAFRRWSRVREAARPDAYVYVTAVNVLRRRARIVEDPVASAAERIGERDAVEEAGVRIAVRLAIDTLPPRQRQAVLLRYVADLPVSEVAEVMGCAVGTAKSTLHRALRSLNVELENER